MVTDRLLTLQSIDTSVARLTARRGVLESGATIAEARDEADEAEMRLGELRLRLDELDRDQRRFEGELESLTLKEAAEAKRMYDGSIVNAKELVALQHEIDSVKKRRSDREDEVLALMELRDTIEAEARDAETTDVRLRSRVEDVSKQAAGELLSVIAELETLAADRLALVPEIDRELLELYEDLRRQKKGVGATTLIDGVCQGCHEHLSAVELDRLKKEQGTRRCEYCRRILVF
jgi:predicted  nucleic acid-binding Zn-ribbon protein